MKNLEGRLNQDAGGKKGRITGEMNEKNEGEKTSFSNYAKRIQSEKQFNQRCRITSIYIRYK